MPLTFGAYVAKNGSVCPVCRSDDLEAGEMQIPDGATTSQSVQCNKCGATWNDVYSLVSYDNLKHGCNAK